MPRRLLFGLLLAITLVVAPIERVFAHEVYVLSPEQFAEGTASPGINLFSALTTGDNLRIFLEISFGVAIVYIANLFFRESKPGQALKKFLRKGEKFGPIFVRAALSISLFASAVNADFLGPELSLHTFPFINIVRIVLFLMSILIALGLFTESAAVAGIILFSLGFFSYHLYLFTYFNYLGGFVALALFGIREYSLDGLLFGVSKRFAKFAKYRVLIVRSCYGIALMYAAISVKFLHPALTLAVVNQYHLTQFSWLFPSDPLLVVFGAALAELLVGLFILIGFELQLTVIISLFYLTLSLFFFGEMVWPHVLLYGISLYLLVSPEWPSVDTLIHKFLWTKTRSRAK